MPEMFEGCSEAARESVAVLPPPTLTRARSEELNVKKVTPRLAVAGEGNAGGGNGGGRGEEGEERAGSKGDPLQIAAIGTKNRVTRERNKSPLPFRASTHDEKSASHEFDDLLKSLQVQQEKDALSLLNTERLPGLKGERMAKAATGGGGEVLSERSPSMKQNAEN